MNELSGDPYEGAHQAYRAFKPEATSQDWEDWVSKWNEKANGEFDNFKAFAELCRAASPYEMDLEPRVAQHIAYASGFFEAMERVVSSLLSSLPISSCIPHHEARYRASLVNREAQFE